MAKNGNQKRKTQERKLQKEKQRQEKLSFRLTWAVGIATIISVLIGLLTFLRTLYLENNPAYVYETHFEWYNMERAGTILSDESVVKFYADSDDNVFMNGATLIALYNNLSDHNRVITSFTVTAKDIVVNESPNLFYSYPDYSDSSDEYIVCHIKNYGWGGTGPISIQLTGLVPANAYTFQRSVELSLKEGAYHSSSFGPLEAGEDRTFTLLTWDELNVDYKNKNFEEPILYNLIFELDAPESGYHETFECPIAVYNDRVQIHWPAIGGPDETYYAILVDTSTSSWEYTYETMQILPANQTIRIPIAIVPTKSCTMSIRLTFETIDGEVIEVTPVENASFVIPYYDNYPFGYIDGLIDGVDPSLKPVAYYWPFAEVSTSVDPDKMLQDD